MNTTLSIIRLYWTSVVCGNHMLILEAGGMEVPYSTELQIPLTKVECRRISNHYLMPAYLKPKPCNSTTKLAMMGVADFSLIDTWREFVQAVKAMVLEATSATPVA
tara:strand:+ start:253 stop:570 length:318 start_codon:yes stop_codon:yes gene_type:complete